MKLHRLFFAAAAWMIANNVVGMIALTVVEEHLENSKCTKISTSTGEKEVVYRPRREDEIISGITWHYTVCQSYDATKRAYYGAGVSAHYTVDHSGTVYCNVSPENIAFHAGQSQFRGFTALNRFFIGIENVHPGYVEHGVTYDYAKWGTPILLYGDDRLWFPFSENQFVANCLLTVLLQDTYKIRRSLVLTHADIAIGKKSDIGPMFLYKRAFTEYGVGYYPTNSWIHDLSDFEAIAYDDYVELIRLYGYKALDPTNKSSEIKAFQMHFSSQDISGKLSDITKIAILNLVANYYFYLDPNHGYDEEFRSKFDGFIAQNPGKTYRLSEFIRRKKALQQVHEELLPILEPILFSKSLKLYLS